MTLETEPLVDVVILTWNDADDAVRAIASALSSAEVRVAVTVVDNASDARFVVDPDPRLALVTSPTNLGVGGGRNLGAAAGEAGFICFLDSDARLDPTCLQRLTACLAEHPGTALSAPVFSGQSPEVGAGAAPTIARKIARGLNLTDRYRRTRKLEAAQWPIEFAIGACQVIRRDAFEAVGGINAGDRFGPEDVDLCLRLADAGWQLRQVADAVCHHVARRSSRRLFSRRGLSHGRALIKHYRRRRRTLALR